MIIIDIVIKVIHITLLKNIQNYKYIFLDCLESKRNARIFQKLPYVRDLLYNKKKIILNNRYILTQSCTRASIYSRLQCRSEQSICYSDKKSYNKYIINFCLLDVDTKTEY